MTNEYMVNENIFYVCRMKLSQFDYILPKQLIAQKPCRPRDHSRLLVLDRCHKFTKDHKVISHHKFFEIERCLKRGDVLVFNDSKVIPARLFGHRENTGGKLEIFLLRQLNFNTWECLVGGRRTRVGLKLVFSKNLKGELIKKSDNQKWQIQFNKQGESLKEEIYKVGHTPTPPYIKPQASSVKQQYQTVYAKHEGSIAAPTAGFHFTKRLMSRLKQKGVQLEFLTLHVGLGTFAPVKTEKIENHKMHPEFAILNQSTCERLNQAKREGRRIIAVGTTSVRVLESIAKQVNIKHLKHQASSNSGRQASYILHPTSNNIDLFIYPGYKFKFVDALITNFHLPRSTLLMLASAFAGRSLIIKVYQEAIKKRYRFYSFGDAMLIV